MDEDRLLKTTFRSEITDTDERGWRVLRSKKRMEKPVRGRNGRELKRGIDGKDV